MPRHDPGPSGGSIAIITISKDDPPGLERTLASIASQIRAPHELALVRAGHSCGTLPHLVQAAKVHDVSLTPSARTLLEMRTNEESFFNFALRMSKLHKSYFLDLYSPNESRQDEFTAEAEASLIEQERVERSDTLSFDDYLARYFAA